MKKVMALVLAMAFVGVVGCTKATTDKAPVAPKPAVAPVPAPVPAPTPAPMPAPVPAPAPAPAPEKPAGN